MKIKSISDVITNSSTEVFLLETTKTVEEVAKILPTITSGYLPPVILDLGDRNNPLRLVYDFGGYLYDGEDQVDQQLYALKLLAFDPERYIFMDIPEFLEGTPLPDFLKIPEEETIRHWIGKIGFSGASDNSIPWDDWGKILKTFGGDNFHLG